MDEKQLQLLFDQYGKSNGFSDYNEFKSLMSNDNSRKVFFDNTNKDLGFKDYNEFNTILKVKPASPFANSIQNQFKQATTVTKQPEQVVSETVVEQPKGNDQFLDGFGVQSKPKPIVNNAGTPIGVSVNKDKSKDGSLLGGIYNTIVGSVARLSGGLGYLETLNPFVQIGKGVKDRVEDISEGKRGGSVIFDARENANPNEWRQSAEQFVEKARSSSSTKEQEQARSEFDITNGVSANDVKGMLFQAPAQVFDMVAGALSGGSSFFIQSVNDNQKELERNPNADKLSEGESLAYLFTQAAVQAALEKFAIDRILKSTGVSKKLTQKISAEITDEFVKRGIKATAKDIEEAAIKKATQLSSKIKSGGIKTVTGIATEGTTEGVQSAASDGVKLLANKISGKDVFNEEDIRNNFIKNVINSTVQGAAFGGIFGGLGATLTNTNKAIRKQISEVQSPEDLQKLATDINEQVELGNITEEEANAANIKAQQYAEIAAKIPTELDSETKYAIIGGIEQREGLIAEIEKENKELEKVDPAFHSGKKAKIELLQAKLDQTNDYIEGIALGEEPTYKKVKDEYFKVTTEGGQVPITKQHYELATAIKENEKIKESEVPEIEQPKESKVTVIMPEQKEVPPVVEQTTADIGEVKSPDVSSKPNIEQEVGSGVGGDVGVLKDGNGNVMGKGESKIIEVSPDGKQVKVDNVNGWHPIELFEVDRVKSTSNKLENLSEKDFDKLTPSQKVSLYKEHGITKEDGSPITEKDIENSPLQYSYDFMASSESGKWNSANSELESLVKDHRKAYSLYKMLIGDNFAGDNNTFKDIVDYINNKTDANIEYTDRMRRADETMSAEERQAAVDSYNKSAEGKTEDKVQKEKDILEEHGLADETEYSPHELVEKFPLKGVQKVIWDIIKPIVEKLGIKVKFSSSRITEGFDGSNNPMNGEILLRPSTLKNGRLGEVLVHEVVHSLTTKIISRVNSGVETGLTGKQVAAVKGLNKLYKSIEADNNLQNKYPVKDIFEFIAHLTNDSFVKELESKDRNFIQKVVDYISDILGLSNANELAKKYLKDIIHDGTFLEKEGITVVSSDYAANVKGAEGLTPKQRLLEAIKNNSKTTAEKYHDLKSKGKENDFTKAVEQSLKEIPKAETPLTDKNKVDVVGSKPIEDVLKQEGYTIKETKNPFINNEVSYSIRDKNGIEIASDNNKENALSKAESFIEKKKEQGKDHLLPINEFIDKVKKEHSIGNSMSKSIAISVAKMYRLGNEEIKNILKNSDYTTKNKSVPSGGFGNTSKPVYLYNTKDILSGIHDKLNENKTDVVGSEDVDGTQTENKSQDTKDIAEDIPPPPDNNQPQSTGGGSHIGKMRSLQKNLINRATGLTADQKRIALVDTDSMYSVLPRDTSRKIAKAIIDEIGVDNAVKLAETKGNDLSESERVMLLGAAMNHYAGEAKAAAKKGDLSGERENADYEILMDEKFKNAVKSLGKLGTQYGQAINAFKDVYQLSNIALARKLEKRVTTLNELRAKDADKDVEGVVEILKNEQKQLEGAGDAMTEHEATLGADSKATIAALEKEVADLKKQIEENTGKFKGTKSNPLNITRKTNDTEYDKRLKEFKSRHRTGLNKDDLSDLTYFGLYHIENGITKFAEWYDSMSKKFGKFKEHLADVYDKVKEDAVSNGADEAVFSNATEVNDHVSKLQAQSDAKKMAQLTKRQAIAELNKAMANNPERARVLAPRYAAKRIRQDAAKNLDMPTTKNEQTYLQRLVNVVSNKAKEYYKGKDEKVVGNDILQFAIANGKKGDKIWKATQDEVNRQIDADTKLSDSEKAEVKDFLDGYIDSTFETLLTEPQKSKIIRDKLIEAGLSKEMVVNGETKKVVDWNKIIGNKKSIQDAKDAIIKAVTDLGYTPEEAKNELNALLGSLDKVITDKLTKDTNAFLNKSIIDKAKGVFGKGVGKSKIQKLIDLRNKGTLDVKEARSVLSKHLGIHEVSAEDYAKVKDLLDKIDTPDLPPFVRKKFEEEVQYIFDKYGGNIGYLKHRDFGLSNALSSPVNAIQNLTGITRVPSKAIVTALKTGDFRIVAKIAINEMVKAKSTANTVLHGDVSRGTSYDEFTMDVEGNPRVRYNEFGESHLLGLPDAYVNVGGGKTVNANLLNAGMRATSRSVGRSLEAADTFSSNPIAALQIYEDIKANTKLLHPELSNKEISRRSYEMMYGEDLAAEKVKAKKAMEAAGLTPTKSQLNRSAYEAVERKVNDKLSKAFYDKIEQTLPIAKERLENRGVKDPTEKQIKDEAYLMVGADAPLDAVASGEREAQRLTGKNTSPGITWLVLKPFEYMANGVKKSVTKEHSLVGKSITNAADAALQITFPYASSIGRWIEFGFELTPYGMGKGLAYKAFKSNIARLEKIPESEVSRMGTDYMLRSIQGAAQTVAAFGLLSMLNNEEDKDKLVTGTFKEENYNKEKVSQVGSPKRSFKLGGHNIPIDLLGTQAIPMIMWQDLQDRMKDPSYDEKHDLLYMSAAVYMEAASQAYLSFDQKYGGMLSKFQTGKDNSASLGKIAGQIIGKYTIPFNRTQADIAQLANPLSEQSVDFGTNVLQQMSITKALGTGKPNYDYRGRTVDIGDIYAMSADGFRKMFEKPKYGDNIDKFLAKIDFAATDAYRESSLSKKATYRIYDKNQDIPRDMTPDEYYEFQHETGKEFDKLLKLNHDLIENVSIKLNGVIDKQETKKVQNNLTSQLLTFSKKYANKVVQKKTGFVPDEDKINDKKDDIKMDIKDQTIDLELKGVDEENLNFK